MKPEQSITAGSFFLAAGTVGIASGQTARLSVVNVGAAGVNVRAAMTLNPKPLREDDTVLQPGQSACYDVAASDMDSAAFDKAKRAQLRAFVRTHAPTVEANLEIFETATGKTAILLPLRPL